MNVRSSFHVTVPAIGVCLGLAVCCGPLEIGSHGDPGMGGMGGMGGQASANGGAPTGASPAAGAPPIVATGTGGTSGTPPASGGASGAEDAGPGGAAGAAGAGGAPDVARVVELATGRSHNCVASSNGNVRCWGVDRGTGQLGLARGPDTFVIGDDETPASAGDVDVGGRVTQLTVGEYTTCALLDTGNVRCWGANHGNLGYANRDRIGDDEPPSAAGDVDVGGPVRQVSAGSYHTCAVLDGGAVRCWGLNDDGLLGYGHGDVIGDDEAPSAAGDVELGGPAVQVAAGLDHTCALLANGSLRCWGYGFPGSLGYGNRNDIGDDEAPASAGDVDVGGPARYVAVGARATCVVLVDGAVRCWGEEAPRQMGAPYPIGDDELPASVAPIEIGGSAVAVAISWDRACALLDTGRVRCWGNGPYEPLGYGNLEYIGDDEPPASAGDLSLGGPVAQIGVQSGHICALLQNGDVRCWGGSPYAEGADAFKNVPLGIPFLAEPIGDDEFPDRFPPIQILDP